MEIRQCGKSGLFVSALGLGTLTWGRDTELHEAAEMLEFFTDSGGSLVECAPWHGDGAAVDVLGHCVRTIGRHRLILAWRGGLRRGEGGVAHPSSSRGAMLAGLDEALERLGTDHVDLWLLTPDLQVPLEESLEALEVAYRSGRAHYVGLDHLSMWDTAQAVWAGQHGTYPPISVVEQEFSLVNAHQQAAYIRQSYEAGLGVFAHSPLAGGVLTGKYRHSTPPDSRAASEHLRHTVADYVTGSQGIVEALARAAQGLERSMADVSLVWVRDHPHVTSAIIGPRTARQLEQILSSSLSPLPTPIRRVLTEVADC
ncbi:aldo/keto reductase [Schaalia sp. lx-260]|uniref:aldo/keto reductase n=1 Tax=Schaalia sp. lx-260 TaxID=2899082 RepID=UPI001E3E7F2C|nr:aldo/keto reductase [Schaalia sp. lx-260]MCD4549571.1 aldo/keto reductase [Schaalia sp. lx-260]